MSYNENLADRVREIIAESHQQVEEKKMFSGICFMVNEKMCVGVQKERLMVRLNPEIMDAVLEEEGCVQMDMNGRIMKAFVLVDAAAVTTKKKLAFWIKLALDYNPLAKAAKKKKK